MATRADRRPGRRGRRRAGLPRRRARRRAARRARGAVSRRRVLRRSPTAVRGRRRRHRRAGGQAAADARGRAGARAAHRRASPVVLTIAAGMRSADLSRWLGGYRAHRARDAEHAGADRRGHHRRLRGARRRRRGARARSRRCSQAAGDDRMVRATKRCSTRSPAFPAAVRRTCSTFSRRWSARRRSWASRRPMRARSPTRRSPAPSALAQRSEADPATLRAQVTSKGGTTERAIATLEERGVKATHSSPRVKAAARRAQTSWATNSDEDDLTACSSRRSSCCIDVVFGLLTYALLLRFVDAGAARAVPQSRSGRR